MNVDTYTWKNSIILAHYEQLQDQNKDPQLAVYRGTSLHISAYKPNGLLEKITQVFKNIIFEILKCIGSVNINPSNIQQLKDNVYQYHLQQVITHKYNELRLMEEKQRLDDQEKKELDLSLEKIKTEYLQVQQLIQRKESVELEISSLMNTKESLLQEIQNLQDVTDQLPLALQRMENILDHTTHLQGSLEQLESEMFQNTQ